MPRATAEARIEKMRSGSHRLTIVHTTTGDILHRAEVAYERRADAVRGFKRFQKAITTARIRFVG